MRCVRVLQIQARYFPCHTPPVPHSSIYQMCVCGWNERMPKEKCAPKWKTMAIHTVMHCLPFPTTTNNNNNNNNSSSTAFQYLFSFKCGIGKRRWRLQDISFEWTTSVVAADRQLYYYLVLQLKGCAANANRSSKQTSQIKIHTNIM